MTPSRVFESDRYLVRRQVMKLAGGAYRVFDEQGALMAYSEKKAFKLKEDIRIFADESKTTELLCIQARQIIDFSAAYDVTDSASGQKVGALRRRGGASILRDEWKVLDAADAEIGTLIEDSMALALVRRLLTNLVPQRYDVYFPDVDHRSEDREHGPGLQSVRLQAGRGPDRGSRTPPRPSTGHGRRHTARRDRGKAELAAGASLAAALCAAIRLSPGVAIRVDLGVAVRFARGSATRSQPGAGGIHDAQQVGRLHRQAPRAHR